MTPTLHIAAAILLNDRQQVLLVRKGGTTAFMQPGGKVDPGEQPLALIRELQEELGLVITAEAATFLGNHQAPAANEPGFRVDCALYQVALRAGDQAVPAAEIEEAVWVAVDEPGDLPLAPLTRDVILPLLRQQLLTP
ncbi:NUDIX hydrolase [Pseudomonas oryzihabitans]|uniref:NUDIX hydrolase n=1 Tax=Pseudomonas oryzihabitans TaxID=47885 RepID=UPI001D49D62C|nr:NUDIX domain-containing protein [Pseudomonas oryzihabitans]HJE68778.1 NUDIX domain-containing protein [Pseudomonas oryzihabitans]